MNNVVVGLAGHIDHGKTALTKALTGIDTDRLREEKNRGISIEPGFAPYRLPNDQIISIIDCPGHERFIKNMLRGISGVDIAILVIAADDGPMPQTREHLDILSLLEMKHCLIALTKIDLVDREWLELVHEEIVQLSKPTFLRGAPIIHCSSRTGEGIDALKTTLVGMLGKIKKAEEKSYFRLPVDRVFSMPGYGLVVTGTLVNGAVKAGTIGIVYPKGYKVKIRGIQAHNQWVKEAQPGQRVGFNLAGINISQINRGNVIATKGTLTPTGILDTKLHYLPSNICSFINRTRVRLYTGTTEVIAKIFFMDRGNLQPGEKAIVQFRLENKACPVVFDKYIIRSLSPHNTIGGGIILDAYPKKYRLREGKSRLCRLESLDNGNFEIFICNIIFDYQFTPISVTELQRKTNLTSEELHSVLISLMNKKLIYNPAKDLFHSCQQAASIQGKIVITLKTFHAKNPLKKGINKAILISQINERIDTQLFHFLIKELEYQKIIAVEGPIVKLATHTLSLNPAQSAIIKKIERIVLTNRYMPTRINQLYQDLEHDQKIIDSLIPILIEQGVLIRISSDTIIHGEVIKELKEMVRDYIQKRGNITVVEFRDNLVDQGRRKITKILEYFDSIGFTRRIGDMRILKDPKGE